MKDLHAQMESLYLDYVNNFMSIKAFASHYGIEPDHAEDLLDLARRIVSRGNTHK